MRSIIALLIALSVSGPAYAASCQVQDRPTMQADQLAGVKTKWRFTPGGGDVRETIEPDLEGLSPSQWMAALESQGVNLAELNVEPREGLSRGPVAPDSAFQAYLKDYAVAQANRTPAQTAATKRFRDDVIGRKHYTPAQRVEVLIDFLSKLEKAKADGEIKGSVRFILHQRMWFRPGDGQKRVRMRERRIVSYSTDMAEVINRARETCLDHWIAGIRIGENGNPDMSSYLPVLPRLAKGVNDRTDGWLRKRLFLANGGGMGAEFAGISDVAGGVFEQLSKETGSFAFGYKLMQRSQGIRYIPNVMAASQCSSGRQCDVTSSGDWSYYIGHSLGFNELKDTIQKYRATYPNIANVVFVGDSSDSVVQLTDADPQKGIKNKPSLTALEGLWPKKQDGWRGRVFMNGFISREDIPRRENGNADSGIALFLSEDTAKPLKDSIQIWKNWPD